MPIQYINTGSGANAGDGDSLRSAFIKVNNNFTEILDVVNNGNGYTGSAGAGYTGSRGIQGPFGPQGFTGSQGAGYTGSASTASGYTGSQGAGYTGSAGVGYTGSAGTALGDRLTAGTTATLVLLADGTLKLTHPTEWWSGAYSLEIQKDAGNYHTFKSAFGLSLQATPVPNGYGLNTNTNFVDIFHDGVSVNVNDNTWTFGTDGILTLPGGYTQISNQGMASTASSVVLASMGATGGAALEWISDPELSTSTKIAFVIANNPLSANSGTVQIATGRITFNGPEEPPVLENVWDFGTNGTLTIPDDIQDANGSVVRVATTSTAPTRVNGQLWYNNIEGRMYIRYSDLWVDASPTIIPPISTYLDGLSVEGTTISALDSTASIYVSGNLVVDGNVISNNQILLDRLTTGSNSVVLGSDGLLTLPGDIIVGKSTGHIYIDAGPTNATSIRWVNMASNNAMFRVYTDDRLSVADERLSVGVDSDYSFYITTITTVTNSTWTFSTDGNLSMPTWTPTSDVGPTILFPVTSIPGGSLGIVAGAVDGMALTASSSTWTFSISGGLTLPGLMTLPVTTSTPVITTATGTVAVCDGTGWDGGGDGFQHLMIYINNTWTKVI